MHKGTVLVREVIGSGIESVRIDKCISTPFHTEDIFEVRHKVLPVQTVIGETGVAFFGEIEFMVYCVNAQDHSLRLVCEKVHYKGFCFFEPNCLHQKPEVIVKTEVKDIFTDIIHHESIRLFAILSTKLILTVTDYHHHDKTQVPMEVQEPENEYDIEILDNGNSHGISVEVIP